MQKNLPAVSIIVPAYNEESYIRKCLEALLAQDYEGPKEIIVVNNASEDRTEEIVRSYPEIKIIYEPCKGIASARQTGFEASRGEIIFSTDADSVAPPGWVSRIVSVFLEDSELEGVNGLGRFYDAEQSFEKFYAPYQDFVSFYALKGGNICYGYNFAIKREAFFAIGGFDVKVGNLADDVEIWKRARKYGKIRFDPDIIMPVSYRRYRLRGRARTMIRAFVMYVFINFFNFPPTFLR